MIILPAIDLMDRQVVRLRQGKRDEKTIYSDDPVAVAKRWESEGAKYLHVVDLNAAFDGELKNLDLVAEIARSINIPIEIGGGMRSSEALESAFNAGVARVVIGTRAIESLEFVSAMAAKFGSDRIAIGIDAKNGVVAVKGWTEASNVTAFDLARRAEDTGAGTIIYTDITTDGMLSGPNFGEIEKLLGTLKCRLIASGGVSNLDDVARLASMQNLYGAIIGKALYDGKISLCEVAGTV
jgi:phosphoribosylformimino-5-aminoimidazole carboxamide ribotide isomerase